jgi:MFS family permease
MSTIAVAGALASGPMGTLIDRFGARPTLAASMAVAAAGSLMMAAVHESWQAFVAASVYGTGFSAGWIGLRSLLGAGVPQAVRGDAFAIQHATVNLGIGIGGITAGLLISVNDPSSFRNLFLLDALSFATYGALVAWLPAIRSMPDRAEVAGGVGQKLRYSALFKDRAFLFVGLLTLAVVTVSWPQQEAAFPAFAVDHGASTRVIGAAFGVNTFLIVGAQLVVMNLVRGKRRTDSMAVMCALYAATWAITAMAGFLLPQELRPAGFLLAMGVFAIGECLFSPTLPAIVNDLAPPKLRGRYNAALGLLLTLGRMLGPALAGAALEAGAGAALFLGLTGACAVLGAASLALQRVLPKDANGVPDQEVPAPKDPAAQAV